MQTKFQNFMQRMVKTSDEVEIKKASYNRVASIVSPKRIIDKTVLQESMTKAGQLDIITGNNAEISWGADGLTFTDTSGRSAVPGQIKITSNGIFTSNSLDNGVRVWVPIITANGINLSGSSYGFLDIQNVSILNINQPNFVWNENGIYAYEVDNSGDIIFGNYVHYNSNGLNFVLNGDSQLSLSWDGLRIGLQDDSTRITSEHGFQVFDDQAIPKERVQIGRFYNGQNPEVPAAYGMRLRDSNGNITLSTDTEGKLWLNDYLTIGDPGDDSVGLTSEYNEDNSVRIWAGGDRTIAWNDSGAPTFLVTKSGELYSKSLMLNNVDYAQGFIINQNQNKGPIKIWAGTQAEYDLVTFKAGTVYLITPEWASNLQVGTATASGLMTAPAIVIDSSMVIVTESISSSAIAENPQIVIE